MLVLVTMTDIHDQIRTPNVRCDAQGCDEIEAGSSYAINYRARSRSKTWNLDLEGLASDWMAASVHGSLLYILYHAIIAVVYYFWGCLSCLQ